MASTNRQSYRKVLQNDGAFDNEKANQSEESLGFSRETEVVAKFPQKRTRQYIYDMLNKIKFPLKNVESIVERRGGIVDFTCQTKNQAKQLAAALECHSDVQFARLVRSDYTYVKTHWIPGRFPNQKIVAAIERHHGKVYEHCILKDRYGIADGRRLYRLKTDDLKQHPIAPMVRLDEMVFLVEYSGQPAQCFLCKGFGHLRYV